FPTRRSSYLCCLLTQGHASALVHRATGTWVDLRNDLLASLLVRLHAPVDLREPGIPEFTLRIVALQADHVRYCGNLRGLLGGLALALLGLLPRLLRLLASLLRLTLGVFTRLLVSLRTLRGFRLGLLCLRRTGIRVPACLLCLLRIGLE